MSTTEKAESDTLENDIGFQDPDSPLFVSSHNHSPSNPIASRPLHSEITAQDTINVVVPPVQRRWEYKVFREVPSVSKVLQEYDNTDGVRFLVRFSDGSESKVGLQSYLSRNIIFLGVDLCAKQSC